MNSGCTCTEKEITVGSNAAIQLRMPMMLVVTNAFLASRTLSSEIKTKTAKTTRETWKMSCNAVHAITVRLFREGRQIVCA